MSKKKHGGKYKRQEYSTYSTVAKYKIWRPTVVIIISNIYCSLSNNKVFVACKVYTSWLPLSFQQGGVESWQCALLPVERGLLMLIAHIIVKVIT